MAMAVSLEIPSSSFLCPWEVDPDGQDSPGLSFLIVLRLSAALHKKAVKGPPDRMDYRTRRKRRGHRYIVQARSPHSAHDRRITEHNVPDASFDESSKKQTRIVLRFAFYRKENWVMRSAALHVGVWLGGMRLKLNKHVSRVLPLGCRQYGLHYEAGANNCRFYN
jgi:hypothetical protein